jgi:hypothetical protein
LESALENQLADTVSANFATKSFSSIHDMCFPCSKNFKTRAMPMISSKQFKIQVPSFKVMDLDMGYSIFWLAACTFVQPDVEEVMYWVLLMP